MSLHTLSRTHVVTLGLLFLLFTTTAGPVVAQETGGDSPFGDDVPTANETINPNESQTPETDTPDTEQVEQPSQDEETSKNSSNILLIGIGIVVTVAIGAVILLIRSFQ